MTSKAATGNAPITNKDSPIPRRLLGTNRRFDIGYTSTAVVPGLAYPDDYSHHNHQNAQNRYYAPQCFDQQAATGEMKINPSNSTSATQPTAAPLPAPLDCELHRDTDPMLL